MKRRAVAEEMDVEILDAVEVGAPVLVETTRFHLVDAGATAVDRRNTVLDPGREHEISDGAVSH